MPAWENPFISGKKRAFMNRGVVITENGASPWREALIRLSVLRLCARWASRNPAAGKIDLASLMSELQESEQ
ncbi:hypothetical protein QU24_04665 [Pantoea rodasii]|uniref:Uncharacterized protein n=1 Tax=Pantoea rodasii TaxID=1076549 RepID=A0A0B1R887_9GAMM|nr:hypothetical protein QU24_04665 [Pantoea rodasii]